MTIRAVTWGVDGVCSHEWQRGNWDCFGCWVDSTRTCDEPRTRPPLQHMRPVRSAKDVVIKANQEVEVIEVDRLALREAVKVCKPAALLPNFLQYQN
jgi:hypothetical protein